MSRKKVEPLLYTTLHQLYEEGLTPKEMLNRLFTSNLYTSYSTINRWHHKNNLKPHFKPQGASKRGQKKGNVKNGSCNPTMCWDCPRECFSSCYLHRHESYIDKKNLIKFIKVNGIKCIPTIIENRYSTKITKPIKSYIITECKRREIAEGLNERVSWCTRRAKQK